MRLSIVITLLAVLASCRNSEVPPPQTPPPAPVPAPAPRARTISVKREGEVVRVHVANACTEDRGATAKACPAEGSFLVVYSVGNANSARVKVGETDRAGDLTFDLDAVLPSEFPVANTASRGDASAFVTLVLFTGANPAEMKWPVCSRPSDKQSVQCTNDIVAVERLDVRELTRAREKNRQASADRLREEKAANDRAEWTRVKGSCGPNVATLVECEALQKWLGENERLASEDRPMINWVGGLPVTVPSRYPGMRDRVAEAKGILQQAEPTLASLREARDWSALDLRPCIDAGKTNVPPPSVRNPNEAGPCTAARVFLARYPNGVHAGEVQAIIDKADKRETELEQKAGKQQERRVKACFDGCYGRCMNGKPATPAWRRNCLDACTTIPPEAVCNMR